MKIYGISLILILTLCFLIVPSSAGWQVGYVDVPGFPEEVGEDSSLALNTSGSPRISYYDRGNGDLKYARWDGSTWEIDTLDSIGDVGSYTSLELNDNSLPCISYYNTTGHSLKYAELKKITSTLLMWDRVTVDTGDVGMFSSLALNGSGSPRISYYDADTYRLKFAKWNGSGWQTETVPDTGSRVGYYTSLALDGSGNPHISYYDITNNCLKYAKWNGTGWEILGVDAIAGGSVGAYCSLALDGSGNAHFSYYDDTNNRLKYAKITGSSVLRTVVDPEGNAGWYTSLALDGSGNPCISYVGYYPASADIALRYAKWTGTSWNLQTIDFESDLKDTSLALDGSGNPHISYYANYALKYAKFIPGPLEAIGVFRPSTHIFYLDWNGNGRWDGVVTDRAYDFGLLGDSPVSGDWDRDGFTEIGVFRPSTHTFYLDWNGNGRWDGVVTDRAYDFGLSGDSPVSGDWDHDGFTEIGVFRNLTHTFYLDWNGNGRWDGAVTDRTYDFGLAGDIPVTGDWGGYGSTEIGVFRSGTHTFYVDYNGNGRWDGSVTDKAFDFGLAGDLPHSSDWGGFGTMEIGAFRPGTHTFYLDYSGNGKWDGAVIDRAYDFGLAGDRPVTGEWT